MSSLTVRRIKMSLYGESYQSDKNEVRGCTVDYILKKYSSKSLLYGTIHTYIHKHIHQSTRRVVIATDGVAT